MKRAAMLAALLSACGGDAAMMPADTDAGGTTGGPGKVGQMPGASAGSAGTDASPIAQSDSGAAGASGAGGQATAGSGGDGAAIFPISNVGCYTVSKVTLTKDGCDLGISKTQLQEVTGTYDPTTGVLSLGKPAGKPIQPSLGAGPVTINMGQLARNNMMMDGSCAWNEVVTGDLSVTAQDTFAVSFTYTQSAFSGDCSYQRPTAGTCTSAWTWTLSRTASACGAGGW